MQKVLWSPEPRAGESGRRCRTGAHELRVWPVSLLGRRYRRRVSKRPGCLICRQLSLSGSAATTTGPFANRSPRTAAADLFALTVVACDQTREVREAAATNPSVPRRSLERLLDDDSWDVRGPAAANPVWGRTKSEQLLKDIYPVITRTASSCCF